MSETEYRFHRPDGTLANFADYVAAWRALAAPIEAATGMPCVGFDPRLTFRGAPGTEDVQITATFARRLVEALAGAPAVRPDTRLRVYKIDGNPLTVRHLFALVEHLVSLGCRAQWDPQGGPCRVWDGQVEVFSAVKKARGSYWTVTYTDSPRFVWG